MSIREKIVKKLENDVEPSAGHIDLDKLTPEKRDEMILKFSEGDENLEEFLRVAYAKGVPSLFCCCGHGKLPAYVMLKVSDEKLPLIQTVGKVLSKDSVSTNFEDNHQRGKVVSFRKRVIGTGWLKTAADVLRYPEKYDASNPTIFYHEEFYPSNKPFAYELKKTILNHLRQQLIDSKEEKNKHIN